MHHTPASGAEPTNETSQPTRHHLQIDKRGAILFDYCAHDLGLTLVRVSKNDDDVQPSLAKSADSVLDGGLIDSSAREHKESRPDPALAVLSVIALICLALYCALGAASVTVGSAKFITNPADTTYPESANIYMAVTAARTGHLYATFARPPYLTQAYGPLYYAVITAIARASHLDFDLVRVRVRLLTYVCFLLSAAILLGSAKDCASRS